VKLIVLLRDPVERALSQYFHSRRLGLEPLGLEAALAAEAERLADAEAALKRGLAHPSHQQHSYLSRSCYQEQLPRFEAFFGADQLLVLRSEALFAQPQRAWEDVLQFLELEAHPMPVSELLYVCDGEAAAESPGLLQLMYELFDTTFLWLHQL
jgi:hypothetical protein